MGVLNSFSGQDVLTILSKHGVSLFVALVSLYIIRQVAIYAKLRNFKGPRWTGFTNLPHNKALLQWQGHEWYAEVNEKHGPIARVAPNLLITSDPGVWAHVNRQPGYKRSDWFYHACRFEYRRDNVFTQTDNEKHEQRRKQMVPGYSGRENLDLEKCIDQRLGDFINLIRSKYVSSEKRIVPMDMAEKVQFFTMDVISAVGFGTCFGMLQNDSDTDNYIEASDEGLVYGTYMLAMGLSWMSQAPIIGKVFMPTLEDKKGVGKMMATCFRYVDERAANPTDKRSDMLASFIRHGITGDALRSEALEQVIAGAETTSTAIRGILLNLMANPRVYAKLQREIAEAIASGNAPKAGGGPISIVQAIKLPYLQAVIREGLRTWPPVTTLFPRDVPPGGDTVQVNGENVFLPGGVCIGYSAFAMHRKEEIYGSDAKVFRPERWLEADGEKLAVMIRTNDLVFGHGRFHCLGKTIAQIEIGKVVFELLRNFDLAIVNAKHPLEVKNRIGLFMISDLWVQVMDRVPSGVYA